MPGIYVRTSGRYDYTEREKDPVLTVPGSYWLCHKKNIYKFTFKYHRSSRNTQDFDYGKELMKVIRRIIKSQPRQGQHFGTHHLLVTYNHTPWTRQDKMFAMLKFRDRSDANAFPRAFILTVKLIPAVSISNNDGEYEDDLIVYDKDVNKFCWSNSNHRDASTDVNGIHNVSTVTSNETSNDSSTRLTPVNSQSMITESICSNGNNHKKTNPVSFFADLDDLPLVERYLLEQPSEAEKSESPPSLQSTHQEGFNEMQETIDMPYQYLIEREIERTKKFTCNKANAQTKLTNELSKKSLPANLNGATSLSRARVNSANMIDNTTARSANITDLVMEGLMFTIRQDKDTITVVEQKTKLEPDEVLENSEKVETKEGGECLVNSSLLKLENLITKIEKSSSAVKTLCQNDSYKSSLSMNSFNTVDNYQGLIDNENGSIINSDILGYNKSKENTFTSEPFRRLNEGHASNWNDSEYHCDRILMNSPRAVSSKTVNGNNNLNSSFTEDNSVVELMEKGKGTFNLKAQLNENHKDKIENQEDTISSKTLRALPLIENNLFIDASNPKRSVFFGTNETKEKLRIPRIISTEVVKYDLSSLRTSRLQIDSGSIEDDKLINNKEMCSESSSPINNLNQPELKLSNEKNVRVITPSRRRRLTAKRRLQGQKNGDELMETTIEMWKFVQDMTYGVRVVLQRLDLSRLSGGIEKNC